MTDIVIDMNKSITKEPLAVTNNQENGVLDDNKKLVEKSIKKILLQYAKNELSVIPADLYQEIQDTFLIDIDFTAAQLKSVPENLFQYAKSLNSISFSNNNLKSIPVSLLPDLSCLTKVNLSENNLKSMPENFFANTSSLMVVSLAGNSLKEIAPNTFKSLPNLTNVDISGNDLKNLPKDLFANNPKILVLNVSSNKLKELLNEYISPLKDLKAIDFSYNEFKEIPIDFFQNSTGIKTIDFSNCKIKAISTDLFNDLNNLQYVDFSCNKIVNLSRHLFVNKNFLVDFRNNIDTNDLSILWDLLFDNYTKFAISSALFQNYGVFQPVIAENLDFERFVEKKNCFDNSIFLCRKINLKLLSANLLSLFLNKTCLHSSIITGEITGDESGGQPIDLFKTYDYKKKKIENFEWSVLDFFMFQSDLNSDVIIYFKNLIEVNLSQNPSLINLEFKFRSTETIACLCQRDDIVLIDAFFPGQSLRRFNSNETKDIDLEIEKILKYVENNDFFHNIDYCECFEICLKNQNEKIAIHLIMMLKYVIQNGLSDPLADLNENKFKKVFKLFVRETFTDFINKLQLYLKKKVMEFNKKFLKLYLPKVFEYEWWELVELVLDYGADEKFIYLLEDELQAKKSRKKKKKAKVAPLNSLKLEETKQEDTENSILVLICQSKKSDLLRHDTTVSLLDSKWKYLPRTIYYFQLFLYFVFLLFYSINIEMYKNGTDYGAIQNASKYISLVLIIYFLLLEAIEMLDSIFSKTIFLYASSFKNLLLIVNFPLCIAVLFLDSNEVKSSLYSITILFSYFMFIQQLDKFYGIGPYVAVFGDVIVKSIKLIIIILICLMGFLLSFRNRANYSTTVSNTIPTFNTSFELGLFNIFTMVIGNDGTTSMGIDNIVPENIVNFIIYGLFIFMVPILFINIFTGIAINAIEELIENSEANIIITKIEYVFKWDAIIKKKNFKAFYFLLQIGLKIMLSMKKFMIFFEKLFYFGYGSLENQSGYFAKAYDIYVKYNFTTKTKSNKNQLDELEKKLNNVLFELNKLSVMNQNKFDYLENKIEANNNESRIDDLFIKVEEINKKIK